MNCIRFLLCLPLVLSSCCPLAAQIKLTETKVQTYVGFENPRIVNGVVHANVGSKPIVASVTSTINVEIPEGKLPLLEAIRKSDFEPVGLIEESAGQYRLPPDAALGTYRISLRAFDPARGFSPAVYLDVTLSGVAPGPVVPEPGNETDRLVDSAMLQLRKSYGQSFASAADAVASGTVLLDANLQKFLEDKTKVARETAMSGINGFIQDKLPRNQDKLLPESAAFLRDLSRAFERGAK